MKRTFKERREHTGTKEKIDVNYDTITKTTTEQYDVYTDVKVKHYAQYEDRQKCWYCNLEWTLSRTELEKSKTYRGV